MANFDVSAIGSFVSNDSKEIAMRSVATAPTSKALIASGNVQFGVKGTAKLLKLSSDVSLVDGSSCGRTGGSTIVLSGKDIVVKPIADEANLCTKSLWNTFYAWALNTGSSPKEEMLPAFAKYIMDDRAAKIAATNEKLIWQGDTSLTGTTNMKRIDGIGKQVTYNATSGTTGSTIVQKLQNFFLSQDVDVRSQDDFVIALGKDVYDEYIMALATANIYKPTNDLTLFGSTAKLFPTSGLNGTRKIYGVRWSNITLGLDGEGDADTANLEYSIETKNFYMDFNYGLGVAISWAEEARYATV